MKEATGELSMTAIAAVAIAAIAGLFAGVVLPMIRKNVVQQTCNTMGDGFIATKVGDAGADDDCIGSGDDEGEWFCCPSGTEEK